MKMITHLYKAISPRALGVVLRRARKRKGLNQTEEGKMVRMDQPTVSRVERGNPGTRLDTLFYLLSVLDLELVVQPRGTGLRDEEEAW